MLKPLSRDTLAQQATDTLRRFILTEELEAGDQLPSERVLSESLSVSRNIVREALSVLVADGLIEKKAGRGIFVRPHDRALLSRQVQISVDAGGSDLTNLSEACCGGNGAAALMAERATEAQIAVLEAINRDLADNLAKSQSTVHDDIEFHKVLFQATPIRCSST
ncbi:MAG: GntR family transcriptional regulator [Caldilineaceae bacterium]